MKKIWLVDVGDGSLPKVAQFGDHEALAKAHARTPHARFFEVAARSRATAAALLVEWKNFATADKAVIGPAAFGALEEKAAKVKEITPNG